MNERLLKIMEYFNYSPSIFADEIGVIRSSISHIISGRNNPGLELLQKVLIRFPQVSSDWLLLGRGEMMLNDDELDKKRMTNVNPPKKLGQLSLEDFTTPKVQKVTDPYKAPGMVESNPELEKPRLERADEQVISMAPASDSHKKTEPEKTPKNKVKRITLFFDDNSFQDFIEEK
jgi:transcriptional regulator with XRE-family HTH domain